MANRFDVIYRDGAVSIAPHFCREYDCHGTNPDHGMSFEDACDTAARWHDQQATLYRTRQHPVALEAQEGEG